jgi:hypothetical protein
MRLGAETMNFSVGGRRSAPVKFKLFFIFTCEEYRMGGGTLAVLPPQKSKKKYRAAQSVDLECTTSEKWLALVANVFQSWEMISFSKNFKGLVFAPRLML